jgi:hypothetical protein
MYLNLSLIGVNRQCLPTVDAIFFAGIFSASDLVNFLSFLPTPCVAIQVWRPSEVVEDRSSVPASEECSTASPISDHSHIAFVFQRYTVFRIPCSRKRNRGIGLFLLMV